MEDIVKKGTEKNSDKKDVLAALEDEIASALAEGKDSNAKNITADGESLVSEAENLGKYADLPEDKQLVAEDEEKNQVLKACDAIEAKIASLSKERTMTAAKNSLASEIAFCERMIAKAESKTSSVADKNGIEEEIGNEAAGEDPSVSTVTKSEPDCETLCEVATGKNEFVAKSITRRLDRCADVCEKRGLTKLAFAIDKMSDEIEKTFGNK